MNEELSSFEHDMLRIEDALFLELGTRAAHELLVSWDNIDGQVAEQLLEEEHRLHAVFDYE
jgi:hypothetical protein